MNRYIAFHDYQVYCTNWEGKQIIEQKMGTGTLA